MRLAYVDEAGISNPAHEPYVVVAAALLHADKSLIATERSLDKIVKRHIPEEHWDTFVFHATHLFNWGGSVFVKNHPAYPLSKRLEIAEEIANTVKRNNIRLAFGWVDRSKFPQYVSLPENTSKQDWVVAQHAVSYMVCAMKIEHWIRRSAPEEVCLFVVEDNDQARKRIRETQQYYQRHDVVEELNDEVAKKHFPLRKIKEDPLFQQKRPGSVLQLADFCAYVFKRSLMGDRKCMPLLEIMKPQIVIFEKGQV